MTEAGRLGNCIAIHIIVLQAGRWLDCIAAWERNCIAEIQLYCNTVECMGFKTVLQYSLEGSKCIAIEQPGCWRKYIAIHYSVSSLGGGGGGGLRKGLYCDTARCRATTRHAGERMRSARSTRAGRSGGCAGCVGGRVGRAAAPRQGSAGRAAGARGAHCTGVGRAAWACCWATGCALGALSLFLNRFDSVLFLSQFLGIVREPGS